MWIKRLVLDNFRSFYGHHDIGFDKGINSLLGPNGGGKTTLIKAFEYCLFGVTRNVTEREIINDRYKDECLKAKKLPSTSVWVELQHGDKQYIINRQFTAVEGGDVQESLKINGEPAENSWIHEHLILPEDFELMNVIGINLNSMIKSFSSKRNAVRNLIGLPLVNKISRSTTMAYNEYISQTKWARDQESAKVARRELLERELEDINTQIGKVEVEESEVKAKLDEAKRLLEEASNEAAMDSETLFKEIEGLQEQHTLVADSIEEKKKVFEELQEYLPYFLIVDRVERKIDEIQKAVGRDINEFYRGFGQLEGQLKALRKYVGKVKPDNELKIEAADIDAEIKKILEMLPGRKLPSREEFNEYMKVEKLLNFIEYLKGLSQKSSQYSAWKKEIIDLEAKEISFKKRLEDAKAEARKSGVKPGEVTKLEANVEHFTRKHASVQTNLERLRQDRDLKSKELRDIIAELSKYSKMSENEEKYARKALALKELFEELVHRHEKDKIAKISSKAQELFLTIIEKPELFTGLELTEDYDIKLHELYHPKGEIPTTRPSTGETDVMYVSVALALNMESGNRMIILDDATINLDNKYTKKVLDTINQFGFEQVIMICKDTIKDLVLTRLDSSRAYAVQYDKLKQTSVITRIVGG